jgi:DNA repair protein RecN (Recombination protein N)
MLRLLRIRNLAVIEEVEVEFEPGFNVLTGETGAGKSILVEAVGLLLGGRASAELVRTGAQQAVIEAVFDDSADGETIVRREVTSQGRSRSFINDSLATAGALRGLSDRLIELHGQHEHQALLDPLSHLSVLDEWAKLGLLSGQVASAWESVRSLREARDRARMDEREKAARLDLLSFQLSEIEKADPKPGEDEELATVKQVLAHADRIQRLSEEAYNALYDSDHAALSALAQVWKRVGELSALDARFRSHLDARDAIKSQLEDLALALRRSADGLDTSPARLQQVEDRLALLERLKRKYGPSLERVIETAAALSRERDALTRADEIAEGVEQSLARATGTYLDRARELSRTRREAAVRFASQVESQLGALAMSRTRFEVRFNGTERPEESWAVSGIDDVEFFVSPNPGEDLRPLAKIVSGGELSRVMLAVKTMAAADRVGKTLIFDEVDSGIGGRVADVVGSKLQQLGRRFQVICITHLPHIASRAGSHFHVEKAVRGGRTVTAVQRLDLPGRIEEIGRMIGGRTLSASVLASAREMLGIEAKGK